MGLTSHIERMLIEEAGVRRHAVLANIELLPVCNLNCKMCYIRTDMKQVNDKGGLRTKEEWLELAAEMRKAGVLFLLLTGGEVFLYPDFKDLYVALHKMGFVITINTNGTLIDEEIVSWLSKYPPKCVSISVYGAEEKTYEAICGKKGIFARVDCAVRMLKQAGIKTEFKTILNPINIHDAHACWQYAKNMDIFYLTTTYTFPPARKINAPDVVRFTPEEAVKARFESNRRISGEEKYRRRIIEHLQKYEDTRNILGSELYGFTCGAARSACWITWQGNMTPCVMLEEPCVKPFEKGFLPAWEELKERCDQILMSPKCSHCDKRAVCTVCPAACYAETGSFEKHSPYHCRVTEYTLSEMNRQVKEWGMQNEIVRREGNE